MAQPVTTLRVVSSHASRMNPQKTLHFVGTVDLVDAGEADDSLTPDPSPIGEGSGYILSVYTR